jgi:hypothetical protein
MDLHDLKYMPPKLAQRHIKLDISIPPTHLAKYKMNPNYNVVMKHDIDKLLVTKFI